MSTGKNDEPPVDWHIFGRQVAICLATSYMTDGNLVWTILSMLGWTVVEIAAGVAQLIWRNRHED